MQFMSFNNKIGLSFVFIEWIKIYSSIFDKLGKYKIAKKKCDHLWDRGCSNVKESYICQNYKVFLAGPELWHKRLSCRLQCQHPI